MADAIRAFNTEWVFRVSPVKVLIIEDNPADLFLIREFLQGSVVPVDISRAADGEMAIRLLFEQGFRPDLILLDLNLPRIDGHEILKRLKTDSINSIPVVIMSSSQNPEDIERALQEGANGYVPKISDLDEFRQRVENTVHPWIAAIAQAR
jgi:two-component system, chemotaxis family, response regulator Rcp1